MATEPTRLEKEFPGVRRATLRFLHDNHHRLKTALPRATYTELSRHLETSAADEYHRLRQHVLGATPPRSVGMKGMVINDREAAVLAMVHRCLQEEGFTHSSIKRFHLLDSKLREARTVFEKT